MDLPTREERVERISQVGCPDLRGDPTAIAQLPFSIEEERLRRPARSKEAGHFRTGVGNHGEGVLVLAGVDANLFCRLEPVAVNPDEEDVFAREVDRHGADEVVVRVGVGTESRQEKNDDSAVTPLRLRERELLTLHRPRFEVRGRLTDLESGERACDDEED